MAHLENADQRIRRPWHTGHAPLEITSRAVNEHCDEEDTVEVWDGRCCADDQAPGEAHGPICHVVLKCWGRFIKINTRCG